MNKSQTSTLEQQKASNVLPNFFPSPPSFNFITPIIQPSILDTQNPSKIFQSNILSSSNFTNRLDQILIDDLYEQITLLNQMLENQEKTLKKVKSKFKLNKNNMQEQLMVSENEKEELLNQLSEKEIIIEQQKREIKQNITLLNQKEEELEIQQQDFEQKIQQIKRIQKIDENEMMIKLQEKDNQLQQVKNEMEKSRNQIQNMYEGKLKIFAYQQNDIDQLKQEIEKEHEHFQDARSEIAKLNKKITYLNKELSEKDDQKFTVFQQLQERNSDNKILQTKITLLGFTIKQKDDEINQLKTNQDFLLKQVQEQRENEEQRRKMNQAKQLQLDSERKENQQKNDILSGQSQDNI